VTESIPRPPHWEEGKPVPSDLAEFAGWLIVSREQFTRFPERPGYRQPSRREVIPGLVVASKAPTDLMSESHLAIGKLSIDKARSWLEYYGVHWQPEWTLEIDTIDKAGRELSILLSLVQRLARENSEQSDDESQPSDDETAEVEEKSDKCHDKIEKKRTPNRILTDDIRRCGAFIKAKRKKNPKYTKTKGIMDWLKDNPGSLDSISQTLSKYPDEWK